MLETVNRLNNEARELGGLKPQPLKQAKAKYLAKKFLSICPMCDSRLNRNRCNTCKLQFNPDELEMRQQDSSKAYFNASNS